MFPSINQYKILQFRFVAYLNIMPRTVDNVIDRQIRIEDEFTSIEQWMKKTHGVSAYEWDGSQLTLTTERGQEIFPRPVVEAVIFANF